MTSGWKLSADNRGTSLHLLIFPLLFYVFFFLLPFGKVLFAGFSPEGFATVISDPYYLKVVGFTVYQALISTVLAVLLGLPGAWLMARFSFPGKRIIRALTTVPFVLPSILVVLGFVILFGNNG
ncbi:MAG: hypothetical protein JW874_07745, partial [Spirochaetales bacterium]|nr:hypothetical protein [Spirochaetales bacterium]